MMTTSIPCYMNFYDGNKFLCKKLNSKGKIIWKNYNMLFLLSSMFYLSSILASRTQVVEVVVRQLQVRAQVRQNIHQDLSPIRNAL